MPDADLPEVTPASRAALRAWLAEHHASATGAWLVYFKKATGRPTVTYDEAVEELLCFGWIDSKVRPIDAERYSQLVTPRKPGSVWSALNKRRVASLTEQGLLMPAGLAKIEAAQADGSWTSLDAVEALEVPADLRAALDAVPTAAGHYAAFSPTSRKLILMWVTSAKRPETRRKRIEETVTAAAKGVRIRG